MPSTALKKWRGKRHQDLNELLRAHHTVGGGKRGRRYATEQLNHAYLVAIAAQFQGFSRDLHTEAVSAFLQTAPQAISDILYATLTKGRRLDQGNANGGSIAEDFGRLGLKEFWKLVGEEGGVKRTSQRLKWLEKMNHWRNAIAHNNFDEVKAKLDNIAPGTPIRPRLVEGWRCRTACDSLAGQMDLAVARFLLPIAGKVPW